MNEVDALKEKYHMTWDELYEIYRAIDRSFIWDDICDEIIQNPELYDYQDPESIQDADKLLAYVENAIHRNDSYYESYWLSIKYCLEDWFNREG